VITIGPRRYELLWSGDEDLINLKDGQQTLVTLDLGPFGAAKARPLTGQTMGCLKN
jgi:hypothetical protein